MIPETYDYWDEHPEHSVADWQHEVANGDTREGYWEWCAEQEEMDHEPCRTEGCEGDPDSGDSYDGYCADCADRLESTTETIDI